MKEDEWENKLVIKDNFKEHFSKLTDFDKMIECFKHPQRRSIRVNTLRAGPDFIKKFKNTEKIPWCENGYWLELEERRDLGNLVEHSLGYFYIQEPSSMIPAIVLKPKDGDFILDMCASPGSKTTQMAEYMHNKGLIIANDVDYKRTAALKFNIERLGIKNVIITNSDGARIKGWQFDKILLDAPCSGTGTIRKSPKTAETWNLNIIKKLSRLQKKLIENAFNNLKKGGVMVYSTCSIEPEENEEVVDYLVEKYKNAIVEEVEVKGLKTSPAILEFEDKVYSDKCKNCLRIWPQDNDTDGFFVTKIKKD